MKSKLLQDRPNKTWMLVFDRDEEAASGLLEFARKENLAASQFTAIGAFSSLEIGFFDLKKRDYEHIPISEQVEVLSLLGDITLDDGTFVAPNITNYGESKDLE